MQWRTAKEARDKADVDIFESQLKQREADEMMKSARSLMAAADQAQQRAQQRVFATSKDDDDDDDVKDKILATAIDGINTERAEEGLNEELRVKDEALSRATEEAEALRREVESARAEAKVERMGRERDRARLADLEKKAAAAAAAEAAPVAAAAVAVAGGQTGVKIKRKKYLGVGSFRKKVFGTSSSK